MEVIYKLINELLETDKLGKQRVVTIKLAKGIEHYANQRAIGELEVALSYFEEDGLYAVKGLKDRIKQLKQE